MGTRCSCGKQGSYILRTPVPSLLVIVVSSTVVEPGGRIEHVILIIGIRRFQVKVWGFVA